MKRKNIHYANLDPTIGAEIKKTRPCLIISPDEMNENLATVMIAPLTSKFRDIPTRIKIVPNEANGLKEESYIVLDQIRTISKERLGDKTGVISDLQAMQVADAVCEIFKY